MGKKDLIKKDHELLPPPDQKLVSQFVDLALHDIKDDIVKMVPEWKEGMGPIHAVGKTDGSLSQGMPKIFIHVTVWLGKEADKQEEKDRKDFEAKTSTKKLPEADEL